MSSFSFPFTKTAIRMWSRLGGLPNRVLTAPAAGDRVLLYSPNSGGHRLMYAVRFAEELHRCGWRVQFAYCGVLVGPNTAEYQRLEAKRVQQALLDCGIEPVELEAAAVSPRREFATFCALAIRLRPALTVMLDGDGSEYVFRRLMLTPWRRLPTSIAAFFIHTEYRDDYFMARRKRRRAAFFYEVMLRYSPHLQSVLFSDERLVAEHRAAVGYGGRVHHLLEPGMPAGAGLEESVPVMDTAVRRQLDSFLAEALPENVLMLWGDLENRKGFDWLLRLAVEVPEFRLVRIGRTKPNYFLRWPDISRKETLYRENRILEIDSFAPTSVFEDMVQRVRFVLMPYHKFFRTSGVMHEICLRGRPVVVPDDSLLGYRVRTYGLGRSYEAASYESFRREALALRSELANAPDCYRESLRAYSARFGKGHLAELLETLGRPNG